MAATCAKCNATASGFCMLHVPNQKVEQRVILPVEERAANLYAAMEALLRHEGRFWAGAGNPYKVTGCNYCGEESRAHDPQCAWVKAGREWKRNAP